MLMDELVELPVESWVTSLCFISESRLAAAITTIATQVDYQALVVLAGPWPQAPSPTLLPGGEGRPSFPLLIIC